MAGLPLYSIGELLDILPDAVIVVNLQGMIIHANPAVRTLLGFVPAELCGAPLGRLIPPALRQKHEAMVSAFQSDQAPSMMMGSRPVLRAMHRAGHLVPVSISICNLSLEDGERASVAVLHDVTALDTHLDRATQLAETDPLTGLANRLSLSRRIEAMLTTEQPFALLFMDLRRFKPFNDRFGHAAGDEALRIVGRRLRAQVREVDVAVRLGGDEFVVLFAGLDDEVRLRERALAIADRLSRPLRVSDGKAALGVDIGGAIRGRHGSTEKALLAAADAAMYAAKQGGTGYRLADG